MNLKYRSKETIEAFQITEESRRDNSNWPEWMHLAWNKPNNESGSLYPSEFPDSDGRDKLAFKNDFGEEVIIDWGEYLINEPHFWLCDEKSFNEMYEPEPSIYPYGKKVLNTQPDLPITLRRGNPDNIGSYIND